MKATWKIGVVVLLIAAVAAVFAMKRGNDKETAKPQASGQAQSLPRLVDLGRETCIPCKAMIPVLAQLRQEYAGRLEVEFINVEERPDAAERYGIQLIPTQVFLDASGKELFRHEGFYSKEDILAKWKELGVDFSESTRQLPAAAR